MKFYRDKYKILCQERNNQMRKYRWGASDKAAVLQERTWELQE